MGKNKSIRIGQNENRSIKKVLEEIENKAIESQYTNMCDWQRRDLSKEDLFEYAEEMRKCLDKIFDMAFAAFIVDNMRKQNMLKDEKIAELLKDNPNER